VTIRHQKTKWGSCSGKKNLNFNCLLLLTPTEVMDSVIIHELCHLKYMNHSKEFYNEVLRVCPNYKQYDRWLKQNGGGIIRRLPK
jgi:predicted metal-dependent hydrolase